jgi:hypothetical protein
VKKLFTPKVNGYIFPSMFAAFSVYLTEIITPNINDKAATIFLLGQLIFTPMLIGIFCAWFRRNDNLSSRTISRMAVINAIIPILF